MVKVLICHNYTDWEDFLPLHEYTSIYCHGNSLFLATTDQEIEIRDITLGRIIMESFKSIDTVEQLIFCSSGKYVATIETKTTELSEDKFVRTYFRWNEYKSGIASRCRIAGQLFLYSDPDFNQMEVIEIPASEIVNCIACCQKIGTLAIGEGTKVKLYQHVKKLLNNKIYSDFEYMMVIQVNFLIKQMVIVENFIAFQGSYEVQVVKLFFNKSIADEKHNDDWDVVGTIDVLQSEIMANKTSVIADKQMVIWDFEESSLNTIKENHRLKDVISERSWPLSIVPDNFELGEIIKEKLETSVEIIGPRHALGYEPTVTLIGTYHAQWAVSSSTLLYRQFDRNKSSDDSSVHSLQFLPLYTKTEYDENIVINPLRCKDEKLSNLCCFFSMPNKGYLYNFTNKPYLSAVYTYSSPSRKVLFDLNLVHVMNKNTIETHSSRWSFSAITDLEPPSKTQACPPHDLENCIIGLATFKNKLDDIFISNTHVLAIEKYRSVPAHLKKFNFHFIRPMPPSKLYTEMLNLGFNAKSKGNMSTTLHLLYEAHMLVRSALLTDVDDLTVLQEQLSKSCLDLGDILAEVNCSGECHQTIAYYLMSGLSLPNMVKHVIKKPYCKGFLEYFQYMFTDMNDVDDVLTEEELDSIFYIYPQLVAPLFLKSALYNYPLNKIETCLISTTLSEENKDSIARFAFGIFDIVHGHSDYGDDPFSGLSNRSILNLGVKYHSWLHYDYKKLSPVGEKLLDCYPDVLKEIVLNLFRSQEFSLDTVVTFFNSKFSSPKHQFLLVQFLESLLAEVTLDLFYEESARLLISIYLDDLKFLYRYKVRIKKHHEHYPEGKGLFVNRFNWLNHIFPFRGCDPKNEHCLKTKYEEIVCPCCCCNSTLMKLQSLLCYKLDITLFTIVQEFINKQSNLYQESLQYLIDHHLKQTIMIENLFSKNLTCLLAYIQEIQTIPSSTWLFLIKMVLDSLSRESQKVDSSVFRIMLLSSAHLNDDVIISLFAGQKKLIPYLKMCLQQKMAGELEEDIKQQCRDLLKGYYGI